MVTSSESSNPSGGGFVAGELPDDKLNLIVLMGATGSGKSTFLNLLAGQDLAKVGHDSESCTTNMQQVTLEMDGRSVCLIDSPGFDDTNKSDYDTLKEISDWLTVTYANNVRVTGIIYLREITESRMRGSTFKNFTMFTKLCGTANLKNVLFVTTKWDLCLRATAESRHEEMKTKFVKSEHEAGARLTHHDNTIQSACGIIRSLMDNPPVVLTIQRELVDMKKTLAETDAGEQLDAALTKEREKWAKDYAESLEAYKKETDANIKKILEDVNTKNKEELDSIDRQKKALAEEGELARQQRVEALEQMVVERAKESGQTTSEFLKDMFKTFAPVVVPAAVGMWHAHTAHQKSLLQASKDADLAIVEANAEAAANANWTQLEMMESQRRAIEAQAERDRISLEIQEKVAAANHTQQRQPPVLGPLAGLFHVLSL